MRVRDLRPDDWPEVARIYEEGIRTGNATFETEVPSWEAWDATHLPVHRFVAGHHGGPARCPVCGPGGAGGPAGWFPPPPASSPYCCAGAAEIGGYAGEGPRGRGVG